MIFKINICIWPKIKQMQWITWCAHKQTYYCYVSSQNGSEAVFPAKAFSVALFQVESFCPMNVTMHKWCQVFFNNKLGKSSVGFFIEKIDYNFLNWILNRLYVILQTWICQMKSILDYILDPSNYNKNNQQNIIFIFYLIRANMYLSKRERDKTFRNEHYSWI